MADTVVKIKADNLRRPLTAEDNLYLKMIENLANDWLDYFHDKELSTSVVEDKSAERLNESTAMCSRPTSVVKDVIVKPKRKWLTLFLKDENAEWQQSTSVVMDVKGKRPMSTSVWEYGESSKKRKVPKKSVRTYVVNNEITERLKAFIANEMKGTDVKLVIQKTLFNSDTKKSQNRLNMPVNQLETDEFLTADERRIIRNTDVPKENKIEVSVLGPTLEMYNKKMELTMWRMASTVNYVLKTHWHQFWLDNKQHLEENSKIQVWSFRKDQQLCFAVACVEKSGGEDNVV